ncbi:MAG TPA: hypothetical protein VGD55_00845, partial [Acidothermaceae bacterium]
MSDDTFDGSGVADGPGETAVDATGALGGADVGAAEPPWGVGDSADERGELLAPTAGPAGCDVVS